MLAEKTVTVIPANPTVAAAMNKTRQLRVAAYCRVSTDQEEQQSSYQAQIDYYTDKIAQNPEWKLAGIFADEGITGVSARKRTEFIKLMNLCEKGKIDLVLTKSISRFSRNTLDCLTYIRMLKERGIPIIFEKEGINTMHMASEMSISMLSSFAQAESESISHNVTWGKRKSFKSGKVSFQYKRILGYEEGENGEPRVNPEEAEIVKYIFSQYLNGHSVDKIKKELEQDGVMSPTGKPIWSPTAIRNIIRNEKYIGDALLQKTYVADFLTKKVKKNNGELPQYYVTGNHEAIISKELFNRVQEEMARRSNKRKVSEKNAITEHGKYSSKYALTELLICGRCATAYRRVTWARNGSKKIVWRCVNRLDYGKKYCKDSPSVEEYKLQDAIMRAITLMGEAKDEFVGTLKDSLCLALTGKADQVDTYTIKKRIDELNAVMLDLVQVSVKSNASADYFDDKFKEISDEIKELQETLKKHEQRQMLAQNNNSRMVEIFKILDNEDFFLTEYDDILVRQLIENVKVISETKIQVTFKGGFEIEQELR
ncbi:MAG: recombinase family protein [Firmicutes bacterium]|nr:recombinase family protein [Bacillota bacterium]